MTALLARALVRYIRATPSHPGRGFLLSAAYALCFRGSARRTLVPDVNGFRMLVSASDRGIGRELRRHRVHEPISTVLFPGMLSRGMNVLDIGANIGYYTLLAARSVGHEGRIVAVEPHPDNYDLLTKNLRLNGITNVTTIPAALSDAMGAAHLLVFPKSNWHSLSPEAKPEAIASIPVNTLTVDYLADTLGLNFGLLRMDVEGWELNILRGAEKTLSCARPRLVMEVHPRYLKEGNTSELLGCLDDLGYSVVFFIQRRDDEPGWWRRRSVFATSLYDLRTKYADLVCCDCFSLFLEPRQ